MLKSYQQLVSEAQGRVNEVTPEQLHSIDAKTSIIIDIREPAEWQQGIIAGASCIARGVLEGCLDKIPQLGQQTDPLAALVNYDVYLYCRSGARSALAVEALQKMGLNRLYSLKGGIIAWQQKGLPLVNQGG